MGQVSVFINGRSYRLGCEDGEEKRVLELARVVSAKVEELVREVGSVGGERLFVMAALLLADEVLDLREGFNRAVADRVAEMKAVVPPPAAAPEMAPALSVPAAKPAAAKAKGGMQVPGADRGAAQSTRG